MSSEEYEVEKILDHKVIKRGKKVTFKYLIKWLNYDENDNTWEREGNIFATDLIVQYWDTVPDHNPDKKLHQKLHQSLTGQSSTENRKVASVPVNVPRVIAEESTDDEEEDVLETREQSMIRAREGATEELDDDVAPKTKRIRLLINNSSVDTSSFYNVEVDSSTSTSTSLYSIGAGSSSIMEGEYDDESDDDIIFNETFAVDIDDWQKAAKKVEYIGREVEGSPMFCIVKWQNGVRSMHPLQVVRERCPQLLIDAFIDIIDNKKK
ncbi:hypothetical protein RMATCC62417_16131 [Rhizopus microsporus]|nr:hypothetical protein RMATCC62417_16131 [Rhizopus microsporus]